MVAGGYRGRGGSASDRARGNGGKQGNYNSGHGSSDAARDWSRNNSYRKNTGGGPVNGSGNGSGERQDRGVSPSRGAPTNPSNSPLGKYSKEDLDRAAKKERQRQQFSEAVKRAKQIEDEDKARTWDAVKSGDGDFWGMLSDVALGIKSRRGVVEQNADGSLSVKTMATRSLAADTASIGGSLLGAGVLAKPVGAFADYAFGDADDYEVSMGSEAMSGSMPGSSKRSQSGFGGSSGREYPDNNRQDRGSRGKDRPPVPILATSAGGPGPGLGGSDGQTSTTTGDDDDDMYRILRRFLGAA